MSTRPPVNDWATDFDHLDPRWIENPYPIWDELRRRCLRIAKARKAPLKIGFMPQCLPRVLREATCGRSEPTVPAFP